MSENGPPVPETLEAVRARLAESERERVAAEDDNLRKAKRIADLEQEVADLKATVQGLYGSSSWRISAPLRAPKVVRLTLADWRAWWRLQVDRADGAAALLRFAADWLRRSPSATVKGAIRRWRTEGRFRPTPESWPADRYDYTRWVQLGGQTAGQGRLPTAQTASTDAEPLFSVLLPVYNPEPALLEAAIDSVRAQTWTDWECCIADDASTDPRISALLQRKASEDPRIRVVHRPVNGHISASTNSALALARGRFVALLDQDDLLEPSALACMADALEQHPDAAILYSDEDRLSADGSQRSHPYFKPDFNYALFLSQNMISHLGVYRRAEVEAVGGLRVGLEGSQDHDLALRVLERIDHSQVVHVPSVLYHWRAIPGSTALDVGEKGYAFRAGARAIQEHLRRTGQDARVEPCTDLAIFHSVRRVVPETPGLHVVIGAGAACPGHAAAGTLQVLRQATAGSTVEWWLAPACADAAEAPAQVLPVAASADSDDSLNRLLLAWLEAATPDPDAPVLIVDLPVARLSAGFMETLLGWSLWPQAGFVAPRIWTARERMDYGGVLFPRSDRACYAHQGWPIGTDSFQLYGYGARALLHQRFTAVAPLVVMSRAAQLMGDCLDGSYQGRLGLLEAMLRVHARGGHNLWVPQASLSLPPGAPAGKWNLLDDRRTASGDRSRWREAASVPRPDPFYHPRLSSRGDFSLSWSFGRGSAR